MKLSAIALALGGFVVMLYAMSVGPLVSGGIAGSMALTCIGLGMVMVGCTMASVVFRK